jgi:hypothetical protein
MSEGNRPPEDVQPLARPVGVRRARMPEDVQPLARPVGDQRARMREFFRRRLQTAREASRDYAWIYRSEIVAEGEAMGLNEAQSLAMTQSELEQNWFVPFRRPEEQRRFTGIVFTDSRGVRRLYGGS